MLHESTFEYLEMSHRPTISPTEVDHLFKESTGARLIDCLKNRQTYRTERHEIESKLYRTCCQLELEFEHLSREYDETNTAPLNIASNGDATVYWQGKWYKFTGQSADIARVLWELKTEKKLPAQNRFITGEVVSRLSESIVSPAQNIGSTMSGHPAIADGLIHNDNGLWDVRD